MNGKFLVIGGTGMLGLPVAQQLKADSFDVTILTTNRDRARGQVGDDFALVEGDVTDPDSLRRAMAGQDYVYLNLNAHLDAEQYERIEIGGTQNAATVANEMGVKRIGTITTASSRGEEEGIIYLDAKVKAEQALKASGVPYTVFRPSWFFQTLPMFVQKGRAAVIGNQPIPRAWLAASDYARQVSKAFQTEDAANKCFYNLGPQPITTMTAVKQFCAAVHPDIKPIRVSFFLARMLAVSPGMEQLKAAVPFFKYYDSRWESPTADEADRILGPNLTTLEEWIKTYSK